MKRSKFTHASWAARLAIMAVLCGCQSPAAPRHAKWGLPTAPGQVAWTTPRLPQATRPARPKASPSNAQAAMAAAASLERQGDTQGAIKAYARMVQKDDACTQAFHRLAVLHSKHGDMPTASRHFLAALDRNPRDTEVLCDFAYHQYLLGDLDRAEVMLRHVVRVRPDLVRAHNNLGLVLSHQGHQRAALNTFHRAAGNGAQAHVNLATALLWQRDLDGADEHFQRALEMDPRSRQAAEGQVAVHRLRKRESSLQERDQPRSAVAGGPVRLPPFPDDHELDGESMAHSAGRRLR